MAQSVFELVGRILIDNADALDKISDTTEQASGLADALKGAGDEADKSSNKMGSTSKFNTAAVWMGNMLYDLSSKAGDLTLKLGKIGFGFNMGIESFEYQFKALLDDEEAAKQLVADIQELAKVSPLGLEGLSKNAVSLLQTGTELSEIVPTLEMLGNLALGNPQNMDSVVRAFTQIIGKGGLMAQEMYQLGDAMVPIVEIMTKYGGERYADGSWYEEKMNDPKYKIPAEDMIKAFHAATAEGGKWHDFMNIYMESFAGQWDRLGEEGKETLGAFFEPLYEITKSEVLPGLMESLEEFRTWVSDNKDTLEKMADSIGKFATFAFDGLLDFFKWMTLNGDAVADAIKVIGTAMGIAAVTAHPYAAAVSAIAGAIMLLKSEAGQKRGTFDHMFDGYTEEDIDILNKYVDAMNAMREAEDVSLDTWDADKMEQARAVYDAALAEVTAIDGLLATYNTWHSAQEGYAGANGPALNVELQIDEDAESVVQSDIDGMNFSATVKMYPDTSALNRSYSYAPFVNGSHANGLDYVPHDGYIARLHQGESVLTRQEASAWRNGTGGFDVDALASRFASIVTAALSGKPVVLESGAVVGQLLPAIDSGLGTASIRKGRRN